MRLELFSAHLPWNPTKNTECFGLPPMIPKHISFARMVCIAGVYTGFSTSPPKRTGMSNNKALQGSRTDLSDDCDERDSDLGDDALP